MQVTVYKVTNLINGKYYIGKHIEGEREYLGSGILIQKAVKKYGAENFKREILESFDNEEDAYLAEARYVTEEVMNDPQCYNLRTGGDGNYKFSQEVKDKMSADRQGRTPWNIGKKVGPQTISQRNTTSILNAGKKNPNSAWRKGQRGVSFTTPEQNRQMALSKSKYVWFTPAGIYRLREDAAKYNGISVRSLNCRCDSPQAKYDDYERIQIVDKKVYTPLGTFETLTEAGKAHDLSLEQVRTRVRSTLPAWQEWRHE